MFDTVAALGARGSRRIIIQIGLFIAFTVGFAILFGVLAVAPALIIKFALNYGFWWTELVLTAMLVSVANAWFWYRQRAQYTKTIRDFPNPGDPPRSHQAEWKSENFDRLLSKYVDTARSANAIDETRKDFDRVAWGSAANEGHLSQRWFAGNHSDIGGSYPETESRLSDISLNWMIGETLKLPYPLKLGPVTVNGQHVVGTGSSGTPLHLYPAANGVQHCEIAGMRDTLDAVTESWPRWLRWFIGTKNYEIKVRDVLPTAKLDETVLLRFDLPNVIDCAGSGLYRPKALRNHEKTVRYYSPTPTVEAIAEKPKTS